jgi:hypothetical protein
MILLPKLADITNQSAEGAAAAQATNDTEDVS